MTTIRNKLEIFPSPNGGIIHIPGSEPTSNHSSLRLVNELKENGRNKPYISLRKALEVIPGATIETWQNSGGQLGVRVRFFVLPDGPPQFTGCVPSEETGKLPCSVNDWYKILAENADGIFKPEKKAPSLDELCSTFTYRYGNSEIF